MPISDLFPFLDLLVFSTLTAPSSSSEAFVFSGCSPLKFVPGSAYETNVDSLHTSLVNPAMFSNYNNFTVQGFTPQDTVYGLFQCRGDLGNTDCSRCVARAVSQLGTLCLDACGGALQLDGCFVKYDDTAFLGVEDKTEVLKKCGPSIGVTSDELTRRDAVLANLGAFDGAFRVTSSGDVEGVAQCVGDLSASECQDCVSDAIERLRMECRPGAWADIYLAKCYARFSERGIHSPSGNDDSNRNDEEIEKTLAILIGLIAGVALIIVCISCLSKVCGKQKDTINFIY